MENLVYSDTLEDDSFALSDLPFLSVIIYIHATDNFITSSSRNSSPFHWNNWLMIVIRSHNGLGEFTYQVKEHV